MVAQWTGTVGSFLAQHANVGGRIWAWIGHAIHSSVGLRDTKHLGAIGRGRGTSGTTLLYPSLPGNSCSSIHHSEALEGYIQTCWQPRVECMQIPRRGALLSMQWALKTLQTLLMNCRWLLRHHLLTIITWRSCKHPLSLLVHPRANKIPLWGPHSSRTDFSEA